MSDEKSALYKIYEGAKELFLDGEHERALDRFQSIYEVDITFRDVAEIVNDYYDEQLNDRSRKKWIAKYQARFRKSGDPA